MKGIKLENVQDFRGGLNLRGDAFELADNESPDLLNVDLDPRGGVEQRRGTAVVPVIQGNPNLLGANSASHEASVGWTAPVNCTLAQSLVNPVHGTRGMRATCTVAGNCDATAELAISVTGLGTYTAFMKMRSVTTPRSLIVTINWFTAGSAFISSSSSATTATNTSSHTIVSITAQAPINAALATMMFRVVGASVGEAFDFDGNQFAKGINPNLWLDPSATTSLDSEVQSIVHYQTSIYSQFMATTEAGLWYSTVGSNTWTLLGAASTAAFVQFKDVLYILSPNTTWAWDGSALFPKMGAFNDNLTTPLGAYVPIAKYAAAFQGSVWVANTTEGSTRHPNRVRFSHPNFPSDYRSFDYFDVDTGLDGDVITGLLPFGDRLLIFKRRAIYAVSGTGPDDFQVYPVTQEVGAIDQRAIVSTDLGVFFFSWPEGVFLFNGNEVRRQFERIQPIVDEGHLPSSAQNLIKLGWSNRRLWVSVPWRANATDAAPSENTRTFILDPTLTKEGSWTVYDFGVGYMVGLDMATNLQFIGASPGQGYLLLLEDPTIDEPFDTLPSGLRRAITSYYRTRWIDLGQPAVKKRWKRPEVVIHSLNAEAALPVQVFTDYDPLAIKKRFSLSTSQDASVMLWGDSWGETWELDGQRSERSEVVRGASLGQARAVQLKVNGPDPLAFNLLTEEESRFEGTLQWAPTGANMLAALSSAQAFEGSSSLLVTSGITSGSSTHQIAARPIRKIPIQPGREVGWSFATRAKDVVGEVRGAILWLDAAGTLISASLGVPVVNSTSAWMTMTMTATAPPGTVTARPYVDCIGPLSIGQGHYVDYAEFFSADSAVGLAWGLNAIAFKYIPRPVRS